MVQKMISRALANALALCKGVEAATKVLIDSLSGKEQFAEGVVLNISPFGLQSAGLGIWEEARPAEVLSAPMGQSERVCLILSAGSRELCFLDAPAIALEKLHKGDTVRICYRGLTRIDRDILRIELLVVRDWQHGSKIWQIIYQKGHN